MFDLICKLDNNPLFLASEPYREMFTSSLNTFHQKVKEKNDQLTLEIVLMLIEYFTFMCQFSVTHEALVESQIIKLLIDSLNYHDHALIVRAAASALKECANYRALNEQLMTN
jgi:hypothetical protein